MRWLSFLLFLLFASCTSKKNQKTTDDHFFPVASFLKSQVAAVDSSLNGIVKVLTVYGLSDTQFIKREEFRIYAQDFLTLPDLSSDNLSDNYIETKLYDEELKTVVLNYTPKDQNAEIRRQEVLIKPNDQGADEVQSIYTEQVLESGDSTVQKRLTWHVDERFEIVTIVQEENAPEQIKILRLNWKPHL